MKRGLRESSDELSTLSNDEAIERSIRFLQRKSPRVVLMPFGSAATGETTQVEGRRWVSDIEIGIVGGIGRRFMARRASRFLSKVLDRDVDVFWIRPSRLRRGARRNFGPAFPNLHAFNLARAEVLGELPRSARPIRCWAASELPRSEGIVLVLNRVGELLSDPADEEYARAKVAMSCGDALLIARGAYAPTYAERAGALSRMESWLLERIQPQAVATIQSSYGFKVPGARSPRAPEPEALRDTVRETLCVIARCDSSQLLQSLRRDLLDSPLGAPTSATRALTRGMYSLIRGRDHATASVKWQLMRREPLEVSIYVSLLASYLDEAGAVTHDLPRHSTAVVKLWRAFCY